MPGIDVSMWQGAINWDKARTRINFAFIKASEGLSVDAQFKRNWVESKRVGGVRRGAYLFYRFSVDPGQQARVMINALAGDYGELPLVVDLEDTSVTGACSAAQLADLRWCLDILERFSGKRPVIYTARWWADPHLGAPAWLSAYDLWVANYVASPAIAPVMPAAWTPGVWKYFQWSNAGIGADYGVQSPTVDLDVAAGEIPVVPVTPLSHPAPTFSASKLVIDAGESVTLSWDAPGASGIYMDGAGVTGPANSRVAQPHPTGNVSTYTLRVTYPGEPDVTIPVTVTVMPKPAPTPLSKVLIGYNALSNGGVMGGAWNEGARIFLVIDNTQAANALAERPATTVIYRQYWDHVPNPDELVNALHPNRLNPKVIRTFLNEREGLPGGVENITYGASLELNALRKLKALNPNIIGAVGTFSTGCPDFTDPKICEAVRANYAEAYNTGLAWWDQHTYSPDMAWIYKGVAQVTTLANTVALPMLSVMTRGAVGRDGHEATWIDTMPVIAWRADLAQPLQPVAATFTDNPTYQDWFETRWKFLFTRCGFDPKSTSRVISGETGVDKMGTGGFVGCGASADQVVAWCKRFQQIQALPVVVNGVSYPSPFVGGAIFQLDPSSSRWAGYCTAQYTAAIATSGVLA